MVYEEKREFPLNNECYLELILVRKITVVVIIFRCSVVFLETNNIKNEKKQIK